MADEEGSAPIGADIQPLYCNSFFLYVGPETTRIIIGDSVAGQCDYESALIMPTSTARELATSLLEMMDRAEAVKRKAH